MKKDTSFIAVVCYNSISYWKSRKRAMDFFREAMCCCEGCEKERYTNIFLDLLDGKMLCEDGSSMSYEECQSENRYDVFPNGTNVRDLTGRVQYPLDEMEFRELPSFRK